MKEELVQEQEQEQQQQAASGVEANEGGAVFGPVDGKEGVAEQEGRRPSRRRVASVRMAGFET